MEYIEVQIEGMDSTASETATAALMDIGYESFLEEENRFCAYISAPDFDEVKLESVLWTLFQGKHVRYISSVVEKKNWNEEWEKNFEPVLISGKCLIRAPFHKSVQGIQYDLVIEPKMSFGTAHHETTMLMIQWMLDEPVIGKHVLDMGCGTGVLAILAAKMGAKEVRAIDNDEWAFNNASENVRRNNVPQVHVIHGDEGSIPWGPFDVILANITRNTLMEQMPAYYKAMATSGALYISGFYSSDLEALKQKAVETGFRFESARGQHDWAAAKLIK